MSPLVFFPRSPCRFTLDRHELMILKRLIIYFFGVVVLFFLCQSLTFVNDIDSVENKFKSAFSELSHVENQIQKHVKLLNAAERPNSFFRNYEKTKIDWHDYEYIEAEKMQTGIGEQGKRAKVNEDEDEERERMALKAGFNAMLSDRIALNRSLPDIRHKDCLKKKYLIDLPNVSIIIPFRREHLSTLLRTVYSVVNRSPAHLIKEIILVDDASNVESLGKPLDDHLKKHVSKAKVVRIKSRVGLIRARIAGANVATGDVYLFLDSHCEATTNWLPPLLEPIAENYKIVMCPLIDVIEHHTFEYVLQDEGQRGGFDWTFMYKRLKRLPQDLEHPSRPFRSPVMAGGLFAISSKYFWELGGYDEGLDIWGGEQYELSFKLWQCGGEMYDAPCSRVGHVYRGPTSPEPEPRKVDFLHINYKRVAEVWMDEYKEYLYMREADEYAAVEAGDISRMKAIREKLECKPFKWYMTHVAFDILQLFPAVEPPDYAWGSIQSISHPHYCLDFLSYVKNDKEIGIWQCANIEHPHKNQFFALSAYKDIRDKLKNHCWDGVKPGNGASVHAKNCHRMGGNQEWAYDYKAHLIKQGERKNGYRCLEINIEEKTVVLNKCDPNNKNMLWKFSHYNATALDNFDSSPVYRNE